MEKTTQITFQCLTCRFGGHQETSCMASPLRPKYTIGESCPLYAMSAQAYMQRVENAQRRIVHMEEQAARYRDMATRITGSMQGAYVRGGLPRSRVEDGMDAFMDICHDIEHEAEKLRVMLQETRTLIGRITDAQEREILELRYLSGYSWQDIGNRMFMSERNVRRIHMRALDHVQREMDLAEYAVRRPGWNPGGGGVSPQPLPKS